MNKNILKPRNKNELVKFIKDEITLHGNECDLNHIDTSLITDMSYLFSKKSNVGGYNLHEFNGNISQWNTSNVQNMACMFRDSQFNQDISNWNTSSVTNMSYMFYESQFNQDISRWNTFKVSNMSDMFRDSQFNQPIGNWDTSSVTNMSYMFSHSQFNQDISRWNTSNVIDIKFMFSNSIFNQDISNWNTSKVQNMSYLFKSSLFSFDLSLWNINNCFSVDSMFESSKISKIPKLNFMQIRFIRNIFKNCSELREPLPDWYQFNHVDNISHRKTAYNNFLKSKKLNNSISNNLTIKNKSNNKI